MPVTFINLFEIPADRDEDFMSMFREVNDFMRRQPGYQAHQLHRALGPDARYRYANVVNWESVEAFRAGHGDQFRQIVSQPQWSFVRATPGIYEVIDRFAAVPAR